MAAMVFAGNGAYAQQQPGSVYVMAGAGFPRQDGESGSVTLTYDAPPGGRTQAWIVGGGVFFGANISVELEISGTGTMSARQRVRASGGHVTYDEDRRDHSFSTNVRLHLWPGRRVQFNPLGGVGIVQHAGWSQLIAVHDVPVCATRLRRDLPTDAGVTMGFDVRVGGEHVAVVPSFRLWRRVTDRYPRNRSELSGQYLGGASEWTLSPGVVARIDF
jgi:hypothetical protein